MTTESENRRIAGTRMIGPLRMAGTASAQTRRDVLKSAKTLAKNVANGAMRFKTCGA